MTATPFFQSRLVISGIVAPQSSGQYVFNWEGRQIPVFRYQTPRLKRGESLKKATWVCYFRNRRKGLRVAPRKRLGEEDDKNYFIVSGIVKEFDRETVIVAIKGNQDGSPIKFTVRVHKLPSIPKPIIGEFWEFTGCLSSKLNLVSASQRKLRTVRPIKRKVIKPPVAQNS